MQFHSITFSKQRDLSQKPLCFWTQITPNSFRCKHAFVTMALTTAWCWGLCSPCHHDHQHRTRSTWVAPVVPRWGPNPKIHWNPDQTPQSILPDDRNSTCSNSAEVKKINGLCFLSLVPIRVAFLAVMTWSLEVIKSWSNKISFFFST